MSSFPLPDRCHECGLTLCECELQEQYEDNRYKRLQAAIERLDLTDCVIMAHEHAADKAEDSPLLHLAQSWAVNPLMDWERPTLSPLQAEGIGRWLAIQLARVMGSRLAVLSSNVAF
jgi:hypothetical protein